MADSVVVEWLNENSLRAYPLTTNSSRFMTIGNNQIDLFAIIVDANFVYTSQIPTSINLEHITYSSDTLVITITGLPVFSIPTLSTQTFPIYVRNSSNDLLVISDAISSILTLGDFDQAITNVQFEPCIAIELSGLMQGINSLTFKNITVNSGVITIKEGYQTGIQIIGNTLQITVGKNEGLPISCQNFFSSELNYDCGAIISFVNGASPRDNGGTVTFKAGDHVKIFEDQKNNRIYIGLDFDSADICNINTLPPQP